MRTLFYCVLTLVVLSSTARAEYKGHSAQLVNSFGKAKPEMWTLRATRTQYRLDSADKKRAYIVTRGGTTLLLLDQKRARSAGIPLALSTLFNIENSIGRTGAPCLAGKCTKAGVQRKLGRLCEKWVEVQTDLMGKKSKTVYFVDKKMHRLIARQMSDGSRLELRRFKLGAQPDALFVVPPDFTR
jgi:hypothetical protein